MSSSVLRIWLTGPKKLTQKACTDEEGAGDDNSEKEDDQPTHFEAGCCRSGRRVTRYMILNADFKCLGILT